MRVDVVLDLPPTPRRVGQLLAANAAVSAQRRPLVLRGRALRSRCWPPERPPPAEEFSIERRTIRDVLAEVDEAVASWARIATDVGVSPQRRRRIGAVLEEIRRDFWETSVPGKGERDRGSTRSP